MKSWFSTLGSGILVATLMGSCGGTELAPSNGGEPDFEPGRRVLLDAHNCYPEQGRWADRIERALGTGVPIAIEQDLYLFKDPESGKAWSLVSHGDEVDGSEPIMREYFFERIRPIVEASIRSGDRSDWPLITLNLDFKTNEPEHHRAVWELLGDYSDWLTTAVRSADPSEVMPLQVGPVLVLTGTSDVQEVTFHDAVPEGEGLRVFGAVSTSRFAADKPASEIIVGQPSNYRRWFNSAWASVEAGGPREAGDWTEADRLRLKELVDYAHGLGLWVRFYTLNGHPEEDGARFGWYRNYNFGSLEAVQVRWQACIEAGVDFIAVDQYEEFHSFRSRLNDETALIP